MTKEQLDMEIIRRKAELFDLQNEFGQIRIKLDEKIKELNKLIQERNSA